MVGFTEGVALKPAIERWRGGGHVALWGSGSAGRRNSTSKGT